MALPGLKVQSTTYSHHELDCSLNGAPLANLQSITWATKRTVGKLYRKGKVIKRTRGQLEATCQITIPLEDLPGLIASGGDGWQEEEFTLSATYFNKGSDPVTLTIVDGCFMEVSGETAETDTEPAMVTIDVDPLEILVDGKSGFSNR